MLLTNLPYPSCYYPIPPYSYSYLPILIFLVPTMFSYSLTSQFVAKHIVRQGL